MDTKALLGQGALIAALAFSNAVFAGSQICDDGLVGYWPLDVDGDEELRGGQGEIEGNVFFAPAIVGNGAEFDGRGAHISSGVNAAVTRAGETDISVSMWARVEPQPTPLFGSGFSALMVARSDCNIGAWQLYGGVEPASLDFNGWDNTFESFFASAGLTLPSQRWTHVVVTSTGDETTYFLDGSFAATSPVRRNAFRDIPQDIYLGWDSCSSFFAGGLDEVAVFDRALSASEVAEIFDKGTGGIPLCEAPEGPEISVSRDGRSIRSGDDDDLGVVEVATTEVSVIIANIGSDALTVGEVRLQAIENVQDLVLTAAPSSEIQAGDQSELVVSFAPISASAFAFEVSVANGDPDENPFVFTISGDANDDPTARFSAELSSSDVEVLLDNDGDGRPNPSDTIRIEGISFRIADAPFDGDVEFTFTAPAGTRLLDAFPEGLLGDRIVSFDVDPVTNRIDARFTRLGLGAFDLFDSIDLLVENDFEGQSISLQGAFLADGVFVTTDNPRTPAPNDAVDLAVGALNRIVPPEGIGSFGASVAVTDRYAAVGSPGGDGSVVIYRILGDGSRQEIGQLEAPPGTAGFGASVSISGDVLAVGSPGDPVARSKGVLDKGSVGLYQLRPAELPFLIGQVDGDDGGEFGQAVDLDGSTLVVGAPGTGADGSGAVFIFDADDLETAPVELMPTRPVANGRFGASLACADGQIAVGSPGPATSFLPGLVSIFDGAGNPLTDIEPPLDGGSGQFGASLALDGNRLLIGAPQASGGSGAVFQFAPSGAMAGDAIRPAFPEPGSEFGRAVAFGPDEILVGAPNQTVETLGSTPGRFGAVYRFNADSGLQIVQISAFSDASADFLQQESFGAAIGSSEEALIIGAPTSEAGQGAAAFRRLDSDRVYRSGFEF